MPQPLHELSNMEKSERQQRKIKKFQKQQAAKTEKLLPVMVGKGVWIITDNPDRAKKRWEAIRAKQLKELEYSHFKPTKPLSEEKRVSQNAANRRKAKARKNVMF